ncbi:MAG TPA: AAA family ATPase [Candidatus Saccharimonadales bacterium]|nr:AAA family ATPase [Candidatus Saccharimonadales bacterium]
MKSLSLSQPHLIIMTGVPGSGKSFFAEKFADTFRAPYVSYEIISSLCSNSDATAADELFYYQIHELLKTQQTVIIEGLSDTRTERSELTRKARASGYMPLLLWVQTDPSTAKNRVTRVTKNKPNRTLTPEEYDHEAKRFTPPNAIEKPVVVSGKHTYATQAKVILKKLSAPRTEISAHTTPIAIREPGRRNITVR